RQHHRRRELLAVPRAPSGHKIPTNLGHLPVELLVQVIPHTLPEGFESLALTCKDIYRLCRPYIGHHNLLRRQFHQFRYSSSSFPARVPDDTLWQPIRNAFDLLERIAAEPVVASYIPHADFRGTATSQPTASHPRCLTWSKAGRQDSAGLVTTAALPRSATEPGFNRIRVPGPPDTAMTDPSVILSTLRPSS
ncbi:hypothetical protein PG987_011723, partial [Apiospora arundinis]